MGRAGHPGTDLESANPPRKSEVKCQEGIETGQVADGYLSHALLKGLGNYNNESR